MAMLQAKVSDNIKSHKNLFASSSIQFLQGKYEIL